MAHLTKYTYSKLCKSVDINQEIDVAVFVKHIYKDEAIYYILNKLELKYLFNYKNILEDEDKFKAEFYQIVPPTEDSKDLVFDKGGKSKYHLKANCSLIKKDYIDFYIPQEIKTLGDEVIEEYRNWFKKNGFAEEYMQKKFDQSRLVARYNLVFPPKYNIAQLSEEFKLIIEIPNSNHLATDDVFNYERFLADLELLKIEYENNFPCKVTRTISKCCYLLNRSDVEIKQKIAELFSPVFIDNYGMDNLKKKLRIAKTLKDKIITNILDYFKWTYKLNQKDFNPITLDYFGLQCCGSCYREAHEPSVS